MKKARINIDGIVKSCGGTMKLAASLSLNYNTILAWKRNGSIPRKYWKRIMRLSSLQIDIEDLHLAA